LTRNVSTPEADDPADTARGTSAGSAFPVKLTRRVSFRVVRDPPRVSAIR